MDRPETPRRKREPIARRAALISVGLLVAIIAIFIIGRTGSVMDVDAMEKALAGFASSPWGLPLLIFVFCVGAFIGIPQFALIAMGVFAFGPVWGFVYGWIANQVSGAVTFWTGRLAGEKAFRRYAGKTANRLSGFVGRNTFTASAVIRIVPSGPFLLVNMAFGVSRARFWPFLGGLAVGSLPKLALVAFAGQSLFAAFRGNPLLAVLAAVGAVGIYVLIALYARARMRRRRQSVPLIDANPVDNAANETE